ncbi:helix-turn-helix domain-containing protein [bacterium]|nr:helix-turn-helix domain-containing protein [bacterium]
MRGRKTPLEIILTEEQEQELSRYIRSRNMKACLVHRAKAVLLVAQTKSITEAARIIGLNRRIVRYWVTRFIADGLGGLEDRPGRGRKPNVHRELLEDKINT